MSEVSVYRINTIRPAFLPAVAITVNRKCRKFTSDNACKIHVG
jgi:hypothetical protein